MCSCQCAFAGAAHASCCPSLPLCLHVICRTAANMHIQHCSTHTVNGKKNLHAMRRQQLVQVDRVCDHKASAPSAGKPYPGLEFVKSRLCAMRRRAASGGAAAAAAAGPVRGARAAVAAAGGAACWGRRRGRQAVCRPAAGAQRAGRRCGSCWATPLCWMRTLAGIKATRARAALGLIWVKRGRGQQVPRLSSPLPFSRVPCCRSTADC